MNKVKVYVASSWKNEFQDIVVEAIIAMGHSAYDFKHPPSSTGFSWQEVSNAPIGSLSFEEWKELLRPPRSEQGFNVDMNALRQCDACLLVLPCGRSAHLELGWACAAGKRTAVLVPPEHPTEPDLMVKMTTHGLIRMKELPYFIESMY